eukprot:gene21952-16405_t
MESSRLHTAFEPRRGGRRISFRALVGSAIIAASAASFAYAAVPTVGPDVKAEVAKSPMLKVNS